MSLRFVHIADSHLGAGGFGNKLNEQGLNQREEDICRAFSAAIDKAITLQPEFVIHAGDLFHTVRPSNRIINFAIKEMLKLSAVDIPIIIISGNHDAPKQRAVGHVLSIFENLPGVYPVFKSKFESLEMKGVTIGCLPHCLTPEILQEEFNNVRTGETRYNILVAHGVAAGIDRFSMAELSEEEIPSSLFQSGFDYVALGHFHKYTEVEEQVYYAGSTERLSFNEMGEDKGLVEVDLESREVIFHKLPVRDMIELPLIDAKGFDYDELNAGLQNAFSGADLGNKIVRLKILNLSEVLYNNLPVREIRDFSREAFYFKLITEREEAVHVQLDSEIKFGCLLDEFNSFLEKRPVEKLDKQKISEMARRYFRRVEQ